jgi:hypothetical protein
MLQEHEATDGPASALSASLVKHFGTTRAGAPGHLRLSFGSAIADAGVGNQNAQLCATTSAPQGGTVLRQNGGSTRMLISRSATLGDHDAGGSC